MFLDEASRKQNYRQVGTKATGQLKKGAGAMHHSAAERAPSSIPSKFETILNMGERESNAFGCRTNRFGDVENEQPGPGAYYKPPSMVVTRATSGSVSKKGMGTGFVSKVKRFNDHNYDPIPGPGQYSARLSEKASFNRRIGLSSFAPAERPTNQTTNDAPGPGEYEQAANAFEAHEQKGSRSVFASRTNRGFIPRVEGPAPGQYENLLALERGIAKSQRQTQSIFKSTVRRVETPKAAVPGPGAYGVEVAKRNLRNDTIAQAQASSMFVKGATDRFGRSLEHKAEIFEVPGPGAYERTAPPTNASAKASLSVFKSSVARGHVDRTSKAPGPAFYKPASPTKRSHLLNSSKKWL
ncbi:hypothetical protein LEN26_020399 [Aphanomyces euteiches]|nr:hypothetical protein LEN26_020399 [Aphanomyces euteiches]